MTPVSDAELACMANTAEGTFFDRCKFGIATPPDFGEDPGDISYAWSDEVACGFKPGIQWEVKDGTQAPMYDALLRVSLDQGVDYIDRVEITKRYGVALVTPEFYTIEGSPARGVSAKVLKLKLIAGVSAL